MESLYGLVPINPVNNEPSIIIENWPTFNASSDVNFNCKLSPRPVYLV